ncbi:MAG: CAAD domain-containing protein [Synechococcaceae cyanobacterium ELA739]
MAETPFSPESSPEGNPAGDFAENVGVEEAGSPFPPTLEVVVEVSAGEAVSHGGDSPAAAVTEASGAMADGPSSPALSTPEAAAPAEAGEAESLNAPAALAPEAPSPAAAPSPVVAAEPASPEPVPAAPEAPAMSQPAAVLEGVATTIVVPPLAKAGDGTAEGGEWELLVGKVNAWFGSGELERHWQKLRGPLQGVAILVGVILALRLYATAVGTIDRIPLVSGLLELTGLIALGHFGLTKMVKTSEREQVLARWKQRWQRFRG